MDAQSFAHRFGLLSHLDAVPRPLLAICPAIMLEEGQHLPWHRHRKAQLLYTLRGILVAYGRMAAVLGSIVLAAQHLACMADDRARAAISLAFLAAFLVFVEVPMFKAATKPYKAENNEMSLKNT